MAKCTRLVAGRKGMRGELHPALFGRRQGNESAWNGRRRPILEVHRFAASVSRCGLVYEAAAFALERTILIPHATLTSCRSTKSGAYTVLPAVFQIVGTFSLAFPYFDAEREDAAALHGVFIRIDE